MRIDTKGVHHAADEQPGLALLKRTLHDTGDSVVEVSWWCFMNR
jgi:hypothetical protein